jgi:hypothetical protein
MRIRDVLRNSFEKLVLDGALPPYRRQGRYVPPPPRFNSPWRPEQIEVLARGSVEGRLYQDPDAWRSAVAFAKLFTAAAAGRGELSWRVDSFGGAFANVPADDLLEHASAVLTGCGFQPTGRNTITQTASFEASDNPTVSALPEPYGKWLQIAEERPRWKEPVALRLIVRVRTRIVLRSDGRHDGFIDVAMSAPALSLLAILARHLGRAPPSLSARSWLPGPVPSLPLSKGHPHGRRF